MKRQEKRDVHVTVWLTRSLNERIERRIEKLPHHPTKSAWIGLVLEQKLERAERERDARISPPSGGPLPVD